MLCTSSSGDKEASVEPELVFITEHALYYPL